MAFRDCPQACPRPPTPAALVPLLPWVSPPAHLLPSAALLAICCSSFPICSESQPLFFTFPFSASETPLLLSLLLTPASTGDPHHPPPTPRWSPLVSAPRDLSPPSHSALRDSAPLSLALVPVCTIPFTVKGSLCSRPSCGERRGLLSVTQAPWNVGAGLPILGDFTGRAGGGRRLGSC